MKSDSKPRKSDAASPEERRPSKQSSREDRLKYYREKYGEDFAFADGGGKGGGTGGRNSDTAKDGKTASARTEPSKSDDDRSESPRDRDERRRGIMKRLRKVLGGDAGRDSG